MIDISNPDSLYLVISDERENATSVEYVTISYRWETTDVYKLTLGSVDQLIAGIPYGLLTQTFQDVIMLTRALGCKYIWIDSLCILQDSVEDWARESNRMADVYMHGFLNICVYSTDIQHGCLQARNPLSWSHCLIARTDDQLLLAGSNDILRDLSETSLFGRGWVFQERLLSPRTIYIGDRDCVFECADSVLSERARYYRSEHPSEGYDPPVSKMTVQEFAERAKEFPACDLYPNGIGELKSIDHHYLWRSWECIVKHYSKTHLTFGSDRLAALAAIATSLRQSTGYTYLAGTWYELFPMCLYWYQHHSSSKGKRSPRRERFPSWSWTSYEFAGTDGVAHLDPLSFNFQDARAKVLGWEVNELRVERLFWARLNQHGYASPRSSFA